VVTVDTVPSVIEMLMILYISALSLPETEPETEMNELSSDVSGAVSISFSEHIPRGLVS